MLIPLAIWYVTRARLQLLSNYAISALVSFIILVIGLGLARLLGIITFGPRAAHSEIKERRCIWVTHSGSIYSLQLVDCRRATRATVRDPHNSTLTVYPRPGPRTWPLITEIWTEIWLFSNPVAVVPGLSQGNPGISGFEKWAGIPGLQSIDTDHCGRILP